MLHLNFILIPFKKIEQIRQNTIETVNSNLTILIHCQLYKVAFLSFRFISNDNWSHANYYYLQHEKKVKLSLIS